MPALLADHDVVGRHGGVRHHGRVLSFFERHDGARVPTVKALLAQYRGERESPVLDQLHLEVSSSAALAQCRARALSVLCVHASCARACIPFGLCPCALPF